MRLDSILRASCFLSGCVNAFNPSANIFLLTVSTLPLSHTLTRYIPAIHHRDVVLSVINIKDNIKF